MLMRMVFPSPTKVLASMVVSFFLGTNAFAQCFGPCAPQKFWIGDGAEYHFDDSVPSEWRTAFDLAAIDWNSMHGSYGQTGMYLFPGGGIRIVVTNTLPPWAVAEWDGGANEIRISEAYLSLPWDQKRFVALHEFGHQMGFDDKYSCQGWSIMSAVTSEAYFSATDYCGFNSYYDPVCEAGGGADYENHCTPLVLTFGGDLPRLSPPTVYFDVGATAELPLCGWLRRPVDGFLTLDRNGDGMITDGSELFGNATPYSGASSGTPAWNGFQALAFFDRIGNGGNGNRVIDPGDSIYSRLTVWFDRNRDGISQRDELVPLALLGVEFIQLNGFAMNVGDRNGNILWFGTSFAYRTGRVTQHSVVVDVILNVRFR